MLEKARRRSPTPSAPPPAIPRPKVDAAPEVDLESEADGLTAEPVGESSGTTAAPDETESAPSEALTAEPPTAGRDRLHGGRGTAIIPPNWRDRQQSGAEQHPAARRLRALLNRPVPDPYALWRERVQPALLARWAERPSRDEALALLRKHRVLLAGVAVTAVVVAADSSFTGLIADGPPAPQHAYRVAMAHPPQIQTSPPSVRRMLNAIANGERLREQAVVAAAARATLDRAKAEAAAAAAGEVQPWMTSTAPVTPGSIMPGIGGLVLPTRGVFTSGFGSRWGTFHNGIDIAGPIGTPIYAVANGTVIDAGPAQGFGLWVRIRHDDGTITVYGHMYDFFVSVGERVPAGMQIARMGNRGDSTGPHLHFEVIQNGQNVDPRAWLALNGLTF